LGTVIVLPLRQDQAAIPRVDIDCHRDAQTDGKLERLRQQGCADKLLRHFNINESEHV